MAQRTAAQQVLDERQKRRNFAFQSISSRPKQQRAGSKSSPMGSQLPPPPPPVVQLPARHVQRAGSQLELLERLSAPASASDMHRKSCSLEASDSPSTRSPKNATANQPQQEQAAMGRAGSHLELHRRLCAAPSAAAHRKRDEPQLEANSPSLPTALQDKASSLKQRRVETMQALSSLNQRWSLGSGNGSHCCPHLPLYSLYILLFALFGLHL